jgi:hypothetical protein
MQSENRDPESPERILGSNETKASAIVETRPLLLHSLLQKLRSG